MPSSTSTTTIAVVNFQFKDDNERYLLKLILNCPKVVLVMLLVLVAAIMTKQKRISFEGYLINHLFAYFQLLLLFSLYFFPHFVCQHYWQGVNKWADELQFLSYVMGCKQVLLTKIIFRKQSNQIVGVVLTQNIFGTQ